MIVAVSLVGAIVGYQLVVNGRWIAAAGGGVLGMIVATFVSGFILMFLPQTIATIEIQSSINKYRNLRRRLTILATFYLIWAAVAVGWLALSLPVTGWLIASGHSRCWFATSCYSTMRTSWICGDAQIALSCLAVAAHLLGIRTAVQITVSRLTEMAMARNN
ncbi:MAG: hypothetical protein CMJ64_18235 [Planctomycetaceae bacterium]|nr:hypothetical protein [Planctomycetaceae bacterium]